MHSNACGIPTESAIIKFSFKEWRKTVILGSARNASVTTNFYINYTHVAYHIFVVLFFYSLLNSNFATLNETVVIQLDVNNGFCLYGLSPSVKRSYYIFIESCISSLLKRQTKNTTEHGEKKTVTSRMNCPCKYAFRNHFILVNLCIHRIWHWPLKLIYRNVLHIGSQRCDQKKKSVVCGDCNLGLFERRTSSR